MFLWTREFLVLRKLLYALLVFRWKIFRAVVFVNTNYSCERVRILKSHDEIANLHRDSEDVFKTGIIERYIARPESVNSMCLAEFASLYKSASKSSGCVSGVTGFGSQSSQMSYISGCDDLPQAVGLNWPDVLELKDGMGFMQKRCRPAIVRTHRF